MELELSSRELKEKLVKKLLKYINLIIEVEREEELRITGWTYGRNEGKEEEEQAGVGYLSPRKDDKKEESSCETTEEYDAE